MSKSKGLTKEKKELLRKHMGSASTVNIDLNSVRDLLRDEVEFTKLSPKDMKESMEFRRRSWERD
jgi:hypothetical protein